MRVFIIGITGAVGSRLAGALIERGDVVVGLVRRSQQRRELAARGVEVHVAELTRLTAESLARMLAGADAVVYAAGSNGGTRESTAAVDGEAVITAMEAVLLAGVGRFALVSVLPEAGRGEQLGDDVEFYFAVKKLIEVMVSMTDVDWLILRPSLLVDRVGSGLISLGPAQPNDEISRADVAETLAELLHEPRIRRRILEVTEGSTPIAWAVLANVLGDEGTSASDGFEDSELDGGQGHD
ncbi:NAD(P)H-binding protein [Demequina muriae]|uniref:NAD(P)H-binding protein n=1 Tax=Demequina muriae TaxID=3051664 RepID=A0ABT8GK71_9MICO|nr:NAD(P)H-binding protein [Demequina sp. EGI L300058]MDN4481639.1 NAD(P)H-binding protein [Demequina sp. EGI L300058]